MGNDLHPDSGLATLLTVNRVPRVSDARQPYSPIQNSVMQICIRVHPAFHNQNLCGIVKAPDIALAGRHAKIRRAGYMRSWGTA
jgi:hypothetical protein